VTHSNDLYLGIDCGTQGLKALVYDAGAKHVVAVGSSAYGMLPNDDPNSQATGRAEQDPAAWVGALVAAANEALDAADAARFEPRGPGGCEAAAATSARRCVRALGVSGQQHGMVCLDKHLEVGGDAHQVRKSRSTYRNCSCEPPPPQLLPR
jgi:sugar (pentulose or hexulose) kinase